MAICIDKGVVFVMGDKEKTPTMDEVFREIMWASITYFMDNYPSKTLGDYMEVVVTNFMNTAIKNATLSYSGEEEKLRVIARTFNENESLKKMLMISVFFGKFFEKDYSLDEITEFLDNMWVEKELVDNYKKILSLSVQKNVQS